MDDGKFLIAQLENPSDPTNLLIQADWLEESGDSDSANQLREIAKLGQSIISIALDCCRDIPNFTGGVPYPYNGIGEFGILLPHEESTFGSEVFDLSEVINIDPELNEKEMNYERPSQ